MKATPTAMTMIPMTFNQDTACRGDCHQPKCDTAIEPASAPIKPIITAKPAPSTGTLTAMATTNILPRIPPIYTHLGWLGTGLVGISRLSRNSTTRKIINMPTPNDTMAAPIAEPKATANFPAMACCADDTAPAMTPQTRQAFNSSADSSDSVSYTHLRAHETDSYLVCRLLLEKKKITKKKQKTQKKNNTKSSEVIVLRR